MRGVQYDHIVFEASGVAEPKLLRAMLQEAAAGWPLMNCVKLETMCTVVDASNFLELFESTEKVRHDELTPLQLVTARYIELVRFVRFR